MTDEQQSRIIAGAIIMALYPYIKPLVIKLFRSGVDAVKRWRKSVNL